MFTTYVEPIGGGAFIFLLVALVAALPYVVWQYRRRGRVSPRRVLAESLFGLYLVCAWALVLMPFPESDAAACARGTGVNTQPFIWVSETAQVWEANGGGWRGLLGAAPLVIRVFNLVLTIPLGVFLRRWFGWSLPRTLTAGLLLSLAFELTQLTGNWWIYECPYRSFDVDDLIANTAGAGVGWLLAPAMFFVPQRREADDRRAQDPVASVPRRAVALVVDVIGWLGTTIVLYLIGVVVAGLMGWWLDAPRVVLGAVLLGWLLGQVVLPWLASGSTLGTAAVGLRIQQVDGSRPGLLRLLGRFVVTFGVFAVGTVLFALPEVVAPALVALLAGVGWWVLLALLAAPRADNATLGDLATGTRVVAGNPPDAPLPGANAALAGATESAPTITRGGRGTQSQQTYPLTGVLTFSSRLTRRAHSGRAADNRRVPNRLAASTSPYLQQHADNPVDWWEWGEEAFAEARRRDVPVFLSVGYAACHWCHVMAHESFENEDIAALLNEHFVSIKVDREERPDVDAIYMAATTALTGHGGWPMSVWLDHDGRPFYAGTYFPDVPRRGMPSFPQILMALAQAWRDRRDEVMASATAISSGLAEHRFQVGTTSLGGLSADDDPLVALADACDVAVVGLAGSFDPQRGGFGGAPKFPPSMVLEYLLRHHASAGRTGDAGALDMAAATFTAMARGGMYDQIGGGFARYSVDADWVVPHFEKMLYDNALLLRAYAHWWRVSGDPLAKRIVRETAEFLLRDLRTAQGGFAAALDADAVPSADLVSTFGMDGAHERAVEGASYVWTPQLLVDALGEQDGTWAAALLNVTDRGTFEHGTSTLQLRVDPDDPERWARVRAALLAARDARPQPARDDKVVAAWNGLAIAALADAGAIFGEPAWIEAAAASAQLLLDVHMGNGELARVSRDGKVGSARGVLADYADVAEGLLALYQADADARWFVAAQQLLTAAVQLFRVNDVWVDHRDSGVLPAGSDVSDNAEPSGAAAAAHALLTFSALGGSVDDGGSMGTRELAGELLAGQVALMGRQPRFAGWWLATAQAWLAGPREVAIVGTAEDRATGALAELLGVARRSDSPGLVIAVGSEAKSAAEAAEVQPPLLRDRVALNGRATAYVCTLGACLSPTTDPAELAAQLAGGGVA